MNMEVEVMLMLSMVMEWSVCCKNAIVYMEGMLMEVNKSPCICMWLMIFDEVHENCINMECNSYVWNFCVYVYVSIYLCGIAIKWKWCNYRWIFLSLCVCENV